ncbi:hypothetical protein [Azospirillum sp. sgz302134]
MDTTATISAADGIVDALAGDHGQRERALDAGRHALVDIAVGHPDPCIRLIAGMLALSAPTPDSTGA